MVALLGSTAFRFAQSLWQQPEYEHGPILLIVALWLLWGQRAAILSANSPTSARSAAVLIGLGLFVYLLGVRVKMGFLEFGSLIAVLAGALYLIGGWQLVRRNWFALLFMLIATPLPAPIVIAATAGLKEWVSEAAETLLRLANYPVARDGVTLRVGPYNLLLADACSGMSSLISLTAGGLAYQYVIARRSGWRAFFLLGSIVPVAVTTNIFRVLILVLITYHLGDQAGQGFLHDFAGIVMFVVALVTLTLVDLALGSIFRSAHEAQHGKH